MKKIILGVIMFVAALGVLPLSASNDGLSISSAFAQSYTSPTNTGGTAPTGGMVPPPPGGRR